MNSKGKIPFGLLFEELLPELNSDVTPTYNEKLGISVIKDLNGELVPYVTAGGPDGTETVTKVAKESTDYSYRNSLNIQNTVTVTHVKREETDSDVNRYSMPTGTFLSSKPSEETGTVTEIKKENTDFN